MTTTTRARGRSRTILGLVRLGILAGIVGGLAEIAWIYVYGGLTGLDAATVALGVSAAVGLGSSGAPALFGLTIHMALATGLGIALVGR